MGIYRSTNPTEFDDIDGIIINESAPSPNVAGVAANVAILVGQFTSGPYELTEVGSIGEMLELYSDGPGFVALKNKKFGRLRVIRVQATGEDDAVMDADYQTAIAKAEVENAGNVLFLDEYNTVRNGYLKTHAALTQDKMVILCGLESDTPSQAIAAVAGYRDVDGRIIYAYPWVQTTINGASTMVNPASWVASVLSQTAPNIDPAYIKNSQYLGGITALKVNLTRSQHIQLKDAGIMALEMDSDVGAKIKAGIVTQIADSSLVTVLRRRMADYLTVSVARFLKNYQNAPNTKENRTAVKAAILAFIEQQEAEGLLPRDRDVHSGKAKLVDTESLNTDATIAAGYFKILWKQRILSSMRFIVIQAEIGESVVVTESN